MAKPADERRILEIQEHMAKERLDYRMVALAAFLGDPNASQAIDDKPRCPERIREWATELAENWGKLVCVRAMVAWLRAALLRWDKPPHLGDHLKPLVQGIPYELAAATELWLLKPGSRTRETMLRILMPAEQKIKVLDGIEACATRAAICQLAVATGASVVREEWKESFADAREQIWQLWKIAQIKRIVANELIPWALGEVDLIAQYPTRYTAKK